MVQAAHAEDQAPIRPHCHSRGGNLACAEPPWPDRAVMQQSHQSSRPKLGTQGTLSTPDREAQQLASNGTDLGHLAVHSDQHTTTAAAQGGAA